MPIMKESWVKVPGLPLFVSDQGSVKTVAGAPRATPTTKDGYPKVSLGRERQFYVHDLVALTFHGPKPEGQQVRHLNDVKTDNRPENLAYGTASENGLDTVRNGHHVGAAKTHCKNGHEFTAENTAYWGTKRRQRFCRECDRERKAA
jgi:hypothetical protein